MSMRAPFVRIYFKDEEITFSLERFVYVYDEENDDLCTLDLTFEDKNIADKPMFKDKTEWKVTWGYMGEPNSIVTRKIYIQDVKWEYEKQIKANITATDKANSTMFDSTPAVFNNSKLPDVAKKIADKHGLKVKVGVDVVDEQLPIRISRSPNISEVYEGVLSQRQQTLKTIFPGYDVWKKLDSKKTSKNWRYSTHEKTEGLSASNLKDLEDPNFELAKDFNMYKAIPQGYQSARVFLNKLARREKGGAAIIDTRDDNIIIRRRNFKQRPYKTYNYQNEPNEIISFNPEYRNKQTGSSASGMGFGGWNREDKSFYEGQTDAEFDNQDGALNNIQEMLRYKKSLSNKTNAVGMFQLDPKTGKIVYDKNKPIKRFKINNFSGSASAYQTHAENTITRKDLRAQITIADDIAALEAVVENQSPGANKQLYDPTANNPNDTFHNAANARNAANLKRNPATLSIEGDAGVEVGIVVGIEHTAKKHSGNYYVIRSEHTIDRSGYLLDMNLVRDGNNHSLAEGENVTKFGKTVNKERALHKRGNSKNVKVKTNK